MPKRSLVGFCENYVLEHAWNTSMQATLVSCVGNLGIQTTAAPSSLGTKLES